MAIVQFLADLSDAIWSMPFLIFFFGVCIAMTVYLGFVQFRYFCESVRLVLVPEKKSNAVVGDQLSPFQAFMNTLGGNIGNGSLAGIPVAIAMGGPGSIVWLLVMSTFSVSLRFAEVYLAIYFSAQATEEKSGPMYYLSLLPCGEILSFLFGLFGFAFMMTGGNLIQCNAVSVAVKRAWNIDQSVTALFIGAIVLYVVVGGSKRIVDFLDKLVPLKVFGFLISAIIVLIYHVADIPQAFMLMISSALEPQAFLGGTFGFALQKSMALGLQRGINASEAGLGTAAVSFANTKDQNPARVGILSMLSVFINTHVVGLMVALCVLVSGIWNNGETSSALLISSFETVYGSYAGLIVTVFVMIFASSVVVAYAYSAKICWLFLTGGRFGWLFVLLYPAAAAYGAIMTGSVVWTLNGLVAAGLFTVNMFGILYFAKTIRQGLLGYKK